MTRVVNSSKDKANNIVVTIRKYGWLTCLFHSFWVLPFILCMTGVVVLFVRQQWTAAIVFLIFAFLSWIKAWLNSNDKLKSSIYIALLRDFMRESMPKDELPIIIRYDSDRYVIEAMMKDGELRIYKVEHIMEKLPLYAVKIHTMSDANIDGER